MREQITALPRGLARLKNYLVAVKHTVVGFFALAVLLSIIHFPYDTDAPLTREEMEAAQKYYTEAYKKPAAANHVPSKYEGKYTQVAAAEAEHFGIEKTVRRFVEQHGLGDKPVLEIGSGRGYLQDTAHNYTGLDISPSVARFYHKRFVVGSATAMPFPDNSFDGVWTIWVFEHVPNPEQAFSEMRRVTKDGGVIFLLAGWNATSWASEGYEIRPYSDFGLAEKLIKASIPLRNSALFRAMSVVPTRIVRSAVAEFGPTKLRYHRLTPNYEQYWVQDSDAVNSIDSHEALVWFQSRGDECLNCDSPALLMGSRHLIIRVKKKA